MAGEAPGIYSFTFSINLILTNIYRRLFDIYRLFGTELSILLNGILLSSSTYPESLLDPCILWIFLLLFSFCGYFLLCLLVLPSSRVVLFAW